MRHPSKGFMCRAARLIGPAAKGRLCRAALLVLLCFPSAAQGQGRVAFRITEPDLIPEGIAYDPVEKVFYVGSTYKRKIVSVDGRGVVRDFTGEGQDGLWGLLGMKVDAKRRLLWAVSSHAGAAMPARGLGRDCLGCSGVFKYDLRSGRLIKKYTLGNRPSAHFLNDLTITRGGDVLLTDTLTGDLYQISSAKDELEPFASLGRRAFPNGLDLSADGKTLFVAEVDGIRVLDLKTKGSFRLRLQGTVKFPIDGLYFYKNSLIAIQPFDGRGKVVRCFLPKRPDVVTQVQVLDSDNPLFSQPTTGVVVGDNFYYLANSNLQVFRRMYSPDGAFDGAKLSAVVTLVAALKPAREKSQAP
jgi:sugar lactone lactonase YvrE